MNTTGKAWSVHTIHNIGHGEKIVCVAALRVGQAKPNCIKHTIQVDGENLACLLIILAVAISTAGDAGIGKDEIKR